MKNEKQIELSFIEKLKELKYIYREDIKDKASLEENFRKRFQELNRVRLSDSEFARLKESIITPDVFSAAKILRETNTFSGGIISAYFLISRSADAEQVPAVTKQTVIRPIGRGSANRDHRKVVHQKHNGGKDRQSQPTVCNNFIYLIGGRQFAG